MENKINTVELDEEFQAIFDQVSREVKMPTAEIISKLLGAHMCELAELLNWLETLPEDSPLRERGESLIVNYGPDDLVSAIKLIDPAFQTVADKMTAALCHEKELIK